MSATALQALSIASAGTAIDIVRSLTFTLPMADLAEIQALAEARRNEVQLTLRLLEQVHAMRHDRSFVRATNELAAQYRHIRGLSGPSLRSKYYAYAAAGDWRALLKGYKCPQQQPAEFVQFVKRLIEDNRRCTKAALRVLRDEMWAEGHPVPGYGTWMEWFAKSFKGQPLPARFPRLYPAGWSVRNLRRYGPSKGEVTLARRGFAAAKKFFPCVTRDPSQLRPLELIVIDDFETDVMTVFQGDQLYRPQLCRTAGLLAIDVATRRKLAFGLKPRLERADGTRMGIRRRDVRTLLYSLFLKHGMPEYPITILAENAAAAITPDFELALTTLFDGRIRVERTGLVDHKTLTNGFCERGGKPWEKGWIESEFNFLWNEAGALKGYKGSRYDNAPGDLEARIAYAERFLAQGDRSLNLPAEKLAALRLPFLNVDEATVAFERLFERADRRTEHKMRGFDRVVEFRLEAHESPRPFAALALLSPEQQQSVEILERMESPVERFERLAKAAPRRAVPESVLALLLLEPKRCALRNQAVTFTHKSENESRGYSYIDAEGTVLRGIAEGTEFLGYFDEANPLNLHVTDLRGAYLGTLRRQGGVRGAVDIRDKAALAAESEITARIFNRTLSEVRARHADQDAALAADRSHNAAIEAEHKATLQLSPTPAARLAQGIATQADKDANAHTQAKALSRARREDDALLDAGDTPAPAPAAQDLSSELL